MKYTFFLALAIIFSLSVAPLETLKAQHEEAVQPQAELDEAGESATDAEETAHIHSDVAENHEAHESGACGQESGHGDFDPGATAFHHISDQNVYSIGTLQLPLPCILYVPGEGLYVFSSGIFESDGHGTGSKAYKGFVLFEGAVRRVTDSSFSRELVSIGEHSIFAQKETVAGKEVDVNYLCFNNARWKLDSKSTADGGLFGGGISSFYDFSITKNVVSMILVFVLLAWVFLRMAGMYKRAPGTAPKGVQSFLEPIFIFIQDEVAKPFLGKKYMKFLPLLMALFFFILGLNLFGQIPFLGGSNVTGNLGVTMVLALVVFIVTNLNGNKHYWSHVFAMPGVPKWVLAILTPVEVLGLFIKPLTLMLRLFANITAGHMVIVIFVSLIFVFSQNGHVPAGGYGAVIPSALLTVFMMSIELLVAFIQAFVFTILTASYIGAAIEEHHH